MSKKGTPIENLALLRRQKDFASRLALMNVEAGRLELYATMHKIHDAVKMVGYEMAGDVTMYDRMEIRRKR